MRFIFVFILILLSSLISQPRNEVEILNGLIEKSSVPIQDFFMSNSISSIQLKIFPDDSRLSPIIKSNLLSKINVDAFSKNKLEVIIKDFNLEYPEIVSFPIFSEEKLKRKISVTLTYIVYTNGEIIFNNNFQEVYSDTIPISTIKFEAQNTEKLPSISFWRKLVEPAIVTSVTGLIIYLFFTVRSK